MSIQDIEKVQAKNFLISDENVVKIINKIDNLLHDIENLNYTSPGLEIIYDDLYKLINFTLELKKPEYGEEYFNRRYNGRPPWEIDYIRPVIKKLLETKNLHGKILDIGCGTGRNTIFLAKNGLDITGIDISEKAIAIAKKSVNNSNLNVKFLKKDILESSEFVQKYDIIIDCGLYHVLTMNRKKIYVRNLQNLLQDGGILYLICSSEQKGVFMPDAVTKNEINEMFQGDYTVDSIERTKIYSTIGRMRGWVATIIFKKLHNKI